MKLADLKPENVFLGANGTVKILDFGLARVAAKAGGTAAGETRPGTVMGTAGHMSPEQVRGEATDATTDIFAFGCVLYEMFAGAAPFNRASAADTMAAILRDDPAPLGERVTDMPASLDALVVHCLEKRPEDRFQSAADMVFALRIASAPAASASLPQTWRNAASRRRPVVVVVSTMLIVGAAAALGFGAWWKLGRTSHGAPAAPHFTQITYSRGVISRARFAGKGQDIVFSASWDGRPSQVYVDLPGSADSIRTGPANAALLSVSSRGELALRLDAAIIAVFGEKGTLARMPTLGGVARPLSGSVTEAEWLPDGESLAVVADLGGRQRLDCGTGAPAYETLGYITDVRVAPRGSLLAFVEHPRRGSGGGQLIAYDCRTGRRRPLLSRRLFLGLAWHPQRSEIWFGQYGGVRAVDVEGHERSILELPESVRMHDIAADGRVLLSQETMRTRMLLQRLDGSGVRDLSWRAWTIPTGFVPDGSKILFSESTLLGQGATSAMRGVDGSAIMTFGSGQVTSVSDDGRWGVATHVDAAMRVEMLLLPIGPGEPRRIVSRGVENFSMAVFVPHRDEIVFIAHAPGAGNRLYRQALSESEPTPISPEGIGFSIGSVSPDGEFAAATWKDSRLWLFPIRGGQPRAIRSFGSLDVAAGWGADARSVYLRSGLGAEVKLRRVNIASGDDHTVAILRAPDTAGVIWIGPAIVSPDVRSVVFSYYRCLSSLYTVSGLDDR